MQDTIAEELNVKKVEFHDREDAARLPVCAPALFVGGGDGAIVAVDN